MLDPGFLARVLACVSMSGGMRRMADFEVEIDDRALRATLDRLLDRVRDATPAMEDIARALRNHTEDAFENERSPFGPAWDDLSDVTKAIRAKDGHWPGPILQVTGGLAGSISSAAGADWASIGAGKVYAATHQFGRNAIKPRPFLPIDAAGNLPEGLQAEILAILSEFLLDG